MSGAAFLKETSEQLEDYLEQTLIEQTIEQGNLREVIKHSLLGGGKRLRPALVRATAKTLGLHDRQWLAPAAAIEMIHCYSLIHDDLPAMDDDDLRRGKPTSHVQFDEASAILAGDALQAMAFELLADCGLSNTNKIQAIKELALHSGPKGMVGGQNIDLLAQGNFLELPQLKQMHALKTGALIECAVVLGALCQNNQNPEQLESLRSFARTIGLAFQIIDDVLDVTQDSQTLGKTQGSDSQNDKPTYVTLLGLEEAQNQAQALSVQAKEILSQFEASETLTLIADFVIGRNH